VALEVKLQNHHVAALHPLLFIVGLLEAKRCTICPHCGQYMCECAYCLPLQAAPFFTFFFLLLDHIVLLTFLRLVHGQVTC